jgi:pyruvate kinase
MTFAEPVARRVRIVATLGPATDRPGVLAEVLRAGVDVVRLNLSHGTADEHIRRAAAVRTLTADLGRNVAILADLPGPKLRVRLPSPRTLTADDTVVFASEPGPAGELGVTDPECLAGVKPGHRVLLDDGRLTLRVTEVLPNRVVAKVTGGGTLSPNKGINLPDSPLDIPAVTPRDLAGLATAAQAGADWLALSFVRTPTAADDLRRAAADAGLDVPVLAKIERPEALDHVPGIIAAFDAIMVARGDLGVEMPLEQVPVIQKRLIAEARAQGKPVITATDMLDSMRVNPRPTRAEASDVANAIADGTDAVMLSGETALGAFPAEAVACMDRIARVMEQHAGPPPVADGDDSTGDDLAGCACALAKASGSEAIIVPTLSGGTAKQMARHRPGAAIVAPVPLDSVRRRLALVWGVTPVPLDANQPPGSDRIDAAVRAAFAAGAVAVGQRAVVLAGHPIAGGPRLPTVRLVKVGEGGASGPL